MNIEKLLNDEIKSEFEVLADMDPNDERFEPTVNSVTKFLDRAIEIDKLNIEHDERERQAKIDKIDRICKHVISGVSVVGGLTAAVIMGFASMNFEKEGTFTSEAGRSAIRQLLKFR